MRVLQRIFQSDGKNLYFSANYCIMTNKYPIRILLAIAIIIGFFLPLFTGPGSMWSIVKTPTGSKEVLYTIIRFAFLLPPLFALFVLVNSISQKPSSVFLRAMPFLSIAILSVLYVWGVNSGYGNISLGGYFSMLGIGYYLTIIGSFLLMFI